MASLVNYAHPLYASSLEQWVKWRLVYEGGDCFLNAYLKKRKKEKTSDYLNRRAMTPTPSFAKSAIQEIANSIYMRLPDVSRKGGSKSYQEAVEGLGLGVDMEGHSMNQFIGLQVTPELLAMAKVGIFVDAPPISGPTLRDQMNSRPYIYMYGPEQIRSWTPHPERIGEYKALLLEECVPLCCNETGLTTGEWTRLRHVFLGEDNLVHVRFYNQSGKQVDQDAAPTKEDYIINLPYIPFVCEELSSSLLADVANHQIALLNLESSDVEYIIQAVKAFYVEQQNLNTQLWGRESKEGEAEPNPRDNDKEIVAGETQGRIYGQGMNPPAFIHPSSEPLDASMKKQAALKEDIRRLVHLALSTVSPKMASAESKEKDATGLAAGLSHVGTVLRHLENRIAAIWADYEGGRDGAAEVAYPKSYSLLTDKERRDEAEQLEELRDVVPSGTFQKEVSKVIVKTLVGHRLTVAQLEKIYSEIEKAESYTSSEEILARRKELGVLDSRTFARLTGMPESVVDAAEKEHADRLARIAESQAEAKVEAENAAARGNPDASGDPKQEASEEKTESRDTTDKDSVEEPTRGEGK